MSEANEPMDTASSLRGCGTYPVVPGYLTAISDAEQLVRERMGGDTTGHDYWHVLRVVKNARYIADREGADLPLVTLGAWLHDLTDRKLVEDPSRADSELSQWLYERIPAADAERVMGMVRRHGWSGYVRGDAPRTLEEQAVFDADKLDAIGAIGIARAFATGHAFGRPIHDPDRIEGGSLGHFHEKLLLVTDALYTATARELAAERHAYLQGFLRQFGREWDAQSDS